MTVRAFRQLQPRLTNVDRQRNVARLFKRPGYLPYQRVLDAIEGRPEGEHLVLYPQPDGEIQVEVRQAQELPSFRSLG